MSLDSQRTALNHHTFVFADEYSGKISRFIEPNIKQTNASYVVVDTGGKIYARTGEYLKEKGYNVIVLNLMEPDKSCHYNPFANLHGKEHLDLICNALLPFTSYYSDKTWRTVFFSSFDELKADTPPTDQNLTNLILHISKQDTYSNIQGIILNNDLLAITKYNHQNTANNLNLLDITKEKTALFIIRDHAAYTYDFITPTILSQLFSITLSHRNQQKVMYFINDAQEIQKIPNLSHAISTRGDNHSINIILNNKSVFDQLYNDADFIISSCDSILYMGTSDPKISDFVRYKMCSNTNILMDEYVLKIKGETSILCEKYPVQ